MLNKDEEKVLGSFDKGEKAKENSKVLAKEDKDVLGAFGKAEMGSANTYQLDFYGIQKGDEMKKMDEEKTPEQKEQEAESAMKGSSEDMEKMMYKMIEEGISKMMEGEDSPMSKMMYKMMYKMMASNKKKEPEMEKALPVEETTNLVKSEPTRGRDALLGWVSK